MAKKNLEPQYIASALNTPMINYKIYVMSMSEKIMTFLAGFFGGGIIGYIFYGGQFLDADGLATTATSIGNLVIFAGFGLISATAFMPIRCEQLRTKRKRELTLQFRSLLETLAVSLSSGLNMNDALSNSYGDLKVQYSEDAYMTLEVQEMIYGIQNNISVESMMQSLGERSEIDDIKNFGKVFEICYRAGGNMKDIVRRTNSIITEKIEVANEIETTITSNKTQFLAMMIIPVVIMVMLKTMSSEFSASFSTIPGIIAVTIAMGTFYAAFKLGQKIMDIKG